MPTKRLQDYYRMKAHIFNSDGAAALKIGTQSTQLGLDECDSSSSSV